MLGLVVWLGAPFWIAHADAYYVCTLSNASFSCTNAAGQPTALPDGVSYSLTGGARLLPVAGADISCRIPKAPVLTLKKALGSNRANATDQFTVQIRDGDQLVQSADTDGTGSAVSGGSTGPTTLVVGKTYTLSEVGKAGSNTLLGQYSSRLSCVNAWGVSGTVLPTEPGGSLTPQAGDEISCTLSNTAVGATVQLSQVLSFTAHRYPVVVTYQGGNGWAERRLSSPSNAEVSSDVQTLSELNQATQFRLTLPIPWMLRQVNCSDANAAVSGNPSGSFAAPNTGDSFSLDASFVRAGAKLQCTAALFAPFPY